MKTESNTKPKRFEIKNISDKQSVVFFYENVKEKEEKYLYDMYRITLNNRKKLKQDIENNYDTWLQFAKNTEHEKLATEIREKRDKLLTETDWTQVTDTVLSVEKQEEYKNYRQALRDITEQEEFPYKEIFPEKPEE